MALPSQGGFTSARRGNVYRRRRKRGLASWVIFFAVVGTIGIFIWPDTDEDTNTNEEVESFPIIATTPTPPIIEIEEVVIPEVEPNIVAVNETPIVEESNEEIVIQPIPLASTVSANLETGLGYLDDNQLIKARQSLSQTLLGGTLSESEEVQARGVLSDISDRLVFSPEIRSDDKYALEYIVLSGDTLSGIVQKMGVQVDWRFIKRINGINKAASIRPGQNLKLITGPFHAVVNKHAYRIDMFLGEGENQVFVCSYQVGLGEYNSTPIGSFKVRRNSKLINPTWVNPRTRDFFSADDANNPIGERWIGLQGIDERTSDLSGLGIHGTIEPETIGSDASMGCIRMHSDDIAEVYEMLAESVSTVDIR